MTRLISSMTQWLNTRVASLEESRLTRELATEREKVVVLEEKLEKSKAANRIQQVEIDELSQVIARNFERVRREIRDLGGIDVKAPNAGESGTLAL